MPCSNFHYIQNETGPEAVAALKRDLMSMPLTDVGLTETPIEQRGEVVLYHRKDYRMNVPWDFLSEVEMRGRSHCHNFVDCGRIGDDGVVRAFQCQGHSSATYIPTTCRF